MIEVLKLNPAWWSSDELDVKATGIPTCLPAESFPRSPKSDKAVFLNYARWLEISKYREYYRYHSDLAVVNNKYESVLHTLHEKEKLIDQLICDKRGLQRQNDDLRRRLDRNGTSSPERQQNQAQYSQSKSANVNDALVVHSSRD